jgi:hypothetical protein
MSLSGSLQKLVGYSDGLQKLQNQFHSIPLTLANHLFKKKIPPPLPPWLTNPKQVSHLGVLTLVYKNPTWCGSWMLLDALFLVEKGLLARPWRMLCSTGSRTLCKYHVTSSWHLWGFLNEQTYNSRNLTGHRSSSTYHATEHMGVWIGVLKE